MQVLGYLAIPLFWLINLISIGIHAADVQEYQPAAAVANPVTRPGRVHPPTLILAAAIVLTAAALPAIVSLASATLGGYLALLVTTALYVTAAAAGLQVAAAGLFLLHHPETLRRTKRAHALAQQHHRPAAVAGFFGAWPRGTGAGTILIRHIADEARATQLILVGAARSQRLVDLYTRLGATVDGPPGSRRLIWMWSGLKNMEQ